jgi:hypothetical protein
VSKQAWEEWLEQSPAADADADALAQAAARQRFYSHYLDMLDVCRAEFGGASNLYALAAYVVWRQTPTRLRVPATQIELAQLLGYLKDDVFRKWRARHPVLFADERTREVVRSMVLDRIPDVVDALLDCAVNGGEKGFQDRQLALKLAGVYKPTLDSAVEMTGKGGKAIEIDYTALSDEERAARIESILHVARARRDQQIDSITADPDALDPAPGAAD